MFCPNCGTKNSDDSLFCENCGTSLAEVMQEMATPVAEQVVTPVTPVPEQVVTPVTPVQEQVVTPVTPVPEQVVTPVAPVQEQVVNQQPVMKQPKKPFKIPKWVFAVAGGAVVFIIALVAFIAAGVGASDYKKTAKNYVTAVEEGKFEKAYGYLALPANDMLTKEMYVKANEGKEVSKVTNIVATDTYSSSLVQNVTKSVSVNYALSSGKTGYDTVVMQKSAKKAMLFFNKYDVSSDGVVVSNVSISVPKGFGINVNGVDLGEAYLSTDKTSKSTDYYTLPYVFVGKMTVKAKSDVYGEVEKQVDVDSYSDDMTVVSFSSSDFTVPQEIISKLESKAKADVPAILIAAANNKSYSDISGMVASSAGNTVKNDYENLVSRMHTSYRKVTSLNVSDVKTTVRTTNYSVDSETRNPIVRMNVNYTLTGQYITSSSDTPMDGKTTVNSSSYYIIYMYENGEWKISNTNLQGYLYSM